MINIIAYKVAGLQDIDAYLSSPVEWLRLLQDEALRDD
jgi:hypothetical protein